MKAKSNRHQARQISRQIIDRQAQTDRHLIKVRGLKKAGQDKTRRQDKDKLRQERGDEKSENVGS